MGVRLIGRMTFLLRLAFAPTARRGAARAAILVALALFATAAGAQSAPSPAKIDLIADVTPPRGNARLQLGLLFHLDPGWHIYWQNAGDSGEPPKVIWSLPAGFSAGPIEWPAPKRLGSGTIIDYGYEDQVLLAAPIRAPMNFDYEGRQSVQLAADVKYIVCREVCIPGKAHLTLSLPITNAAQSNEWHELFVRTRKQLPVHAPAGWKISARAAQDSLVIAVAGDGQPRSASFFPLDVNIIENSAPQNLATDKNGFHLTVKMSDQRTGQPGRLRGVLVLNGGEAYQVAVPVATR
jgi:DsbC/DsbD-like thiol-disulfide interchange protein